MKAAYPIVITQEKDVKLVYVPDFDINTQGEDMADAIDMARDAIGIVGITMEDDGEALPSPSRMEDIHPEEGMVTLVDIDFSAYRAENDMRAVKKNCTIPSWLNVRAEKAGINFSATLQAALKKELHITGR